MLYTPSQPFAFEEPSVSKRSNRALFQAVVEALPSPDVCLLLIGGADWRSFTLRGAQSILRFDRRSSPWSHAALVLTWDAQDVGKSVGVEVTLDPEDPRYQVPERNGVTHFRLRRYFDAVRYPNVCVAHFTPPPSPEGSSGSELVADAARLPVRDDMRFPLWDSLGTWCAHAFDPHRTHNPLLDGIGMPAAMLCVSAYEAAGVPLAPGATDVNIAPEHLWATLKYWHGRLGDGVQLRAWRAVRDRVGMALPPLSLQLPEAPEH